MNLQRAETIVQYGSIICEGVKVSGIIHAAQRSFLCTHSYMTDIVFFARSLSFLSVGLKLT
jgi:hypothetical protein